MTREEAKNWLRKLYARADITDEYGDMEDMQPYEEALDMAISALSAPSTNVISIDQANAMIKSYVSHYEENKGEWKMPIQDDGMSDPIYYQVRCSKCGFDLDPQTWHQELHQYGADNFCPNCGADMRGE